MSRDEFKRRDPPSAERREYARVNVECPAVYRMAPHHGHPQPKRADAPGGSRRPAHPLPLTPLGDGDIPKHDDDPSTARMMELMLWMDWKLNFLVRQLTSSKDARHFPHSAVIVNLSAGGMRCVTPHAVKDGNLLEFELVLPVVPYREMIIIGEVVRSHPVSIEGNPEVECDVKFKEIRTADQELIARYVVQRQMQLQRERRAGGKL